MSYPAVSLTPDIQTPLDIKCDTFLSSAHFNIILAICIKQVTTSAIILTMRDEFEAPPSRVHCFLLSANGRRGSIYQPINIGIHRGYHIIAIDTERFFYSIDPWFQVDKDGDLLVNNDGGWFICVGGSKINKWQFSWFFHWTVGEKSDGGICHPIHLAASA